MDRPLWQIVMTLLLAGFAVQRGAAAVVAELGGAPAGLWLGYGLQAAATLAAALGLWLGRRWAASALVALAIVSIASGLYAVAAFPGGMAPAALSQAFVVALGAGGLAWLLRRELGQESTGATRP